MALKYQSPVVHRASRVFSTTLRPPEAVSFSQWAEQNFRLSAESSAVQGRFRPWKFQRGILDAIGDPTLERVTVLKAARIGYTKSLIASIGAIAATDPCPIILLMPTDDDARGIAVDEIDPAFRDSPVLKGLMRQGRLDGRSTLTQRSLKGGGSLKILSARAPRNLRRHTAKVLFGDEVDGMEITPEGDPIALAEMRTMSFADRKIVMGSTPTDEATSIIAKLYRESDMRVFEVPCPNCGGCFQLKWEHIKWPTGKPREAFAVCPECDDPIAENRKPEMVESGDWRPTAPHVVGHAGFQTSALVSMFANASWGKLAEEWEKARRAGPASEQVFVNTVLGIPWSTALNAVSEHELQARAEKFGLSLALDGSGWDADIPESVLYITAGVDVQVDRLEVTSLGWSHDGQRWILGHEVIRGSAKDQSTWDELDAMLGTEFKHPLGGRIGFEAACIDSGDGNMTQPVYDFCNPRLSRRIVAIKGVTGARPVIKAASGRKARAKGIPLWLIGVDQVKTDILTTLHFEKGRANAFRFSNRLSTQWFEQFTAERREVKYRQGRPVVEFVRIGNRQAEALDASVYAIAARGICRFDFDKRAAQLTVATGKPKVSLREIAARLSGNN